MVTFFSTISNPLITVCIPVYNQEDFVSEAIDSVLSQGIENIQIIIADDGSTDSTPEILKEYKEKFPEIIDLILHEENQGIPGNVNSIYPLIRGKYLSWFAGDDCFLKNKLKKQIEFLEAHKEFVMCYHDVLVKDRATGRGYRFNDPEQGIRPYSGNIAGQLITYGCFVPPMSIVIRRESTKDIQHRHEVGQSNDWLYIIELAMQGPVYYLDEVLGVYYRHEKNVTSQGFYHIHAESVYNFLEKKYKDMFENEINKGKLNLYIDFIFQYLYERKIDSLKELTLKIIQLLGENKRFIPYALKKIFLRLIQRIAKLFNVLHVKRAKNELA